MVSLISLSPACLAEAVAAKEADSSSLPRHALEVRALTEPDQVLLELPGLMSKAKAANDEHELALLQLARANACRVVADWSCQRQAGAAARSAADTAGDAVLAIRGLIAESRASIGLQDYTQGERLLGQAELRLKSTPQPELSADVDLAYSSLSYSLGKHALAAEFAERGLAHLGPDQALPMQVRLLRNRGRALAQLNRLQEGRQVLDHALEVSERFVDPKLSAELYVEAARMARMGHDDEGQRRNGLRVIELGKELANSQLAGMGHEVLGMAALDTGKLEDAAKELRIALDSFRALNLVRDELRIARELAGVLSNLGRSEEMVPLVRRFIQLDREVIDAERAQAADDFDARLKYAEQEISVVRLESEAKVAQVRERSLAAQNRLSRIAVALALVTLAVLTALFVLQRRSNRRMRETMAALRESEARATDLLRLSSGFVFLHDRSGHLLMVNPATAHALGLEPSALVGRSLRDFMPPDAQHEFEAYLKRVGESQRDEGTLRIRPEHGEEFHWRYSNRMSATDANRAYVIGHAVDVTEQIEQALKLREQNVHDALTGCYNRRYLEQFERTWSDHGTWAAVNVDLDHFKQINDTHGHDRGDEVLIEFVKFLQHQVHGKDAVVRTGGDEFLVLLADAGESALEDLLERLRVKAPQAPCGFSVGSALRKDREPLADTLGRADQAMYEARSRRRK